MAEHKGARNAGFRSITPAVWFLPTVLLVAALAPLPYGYYTLMRIVVCAAAGFLAWAHFGREGGVGAWSVLLGLVAVLFNPIIPIHLSRGIWAPIDIGAAVIFGVNFFVCRPGRM